MKYRSLNADTRKNVQTRERPSDPCSNGHNCSYILPPVSIDLHRLFDATKDNKPTGWFWIPTDDNFVLLTVMHSDYVGGGIVTEKAGMTANKRCDLEDVCPVPLVLEKC